MEERYLLITRHLAKETSEEENIYLKEWIALSSANAQTFEEIRNMWLASFQRDDTAAIHAFQRLDQKIKNSKLLLEIAQPVKAYSNKMRRYAIASSLIVLFILSGLFYKFYTQAKPVYVSQFTRAGEKKQILLPDGTKVFLAPQSQLRYPEHFATKKRIVELQGEAYFEVSKKHNQPFSVHTSTLDVLVLGTHFNVNSYKSNITTVVSLMEGKVKVTVAEDDQDEYLLVPGQELSLNKINHQVYQREFDQESITGWMTNTLLIKNEKLGQVAGKINQLYGVKIIFADQATADIRLYAKFKNESLLTVLETIKATGNISYRIEKNKVYLTLKN